MRTATCITLGLISILPVFGQQDIFRSRIGVTAAVDRYLGEIEQRYSDVEWENSSFTGLKYQMFLSYGISMYGQVSLLELSANDRISGNFDRGLNFKTEARTFEVGLNFYSDNGRILKFDARFAPFIGVGFGVGSYDVHGDLFRSNGQRYHYWTDGTIHDLAQDDPDAANSNVITQDGVFETCLTTCPTEMDRPEEPFYLYIPGQVGIKWRISSRLSADLIYGFNWTFTDHLDDIHSASYAEPESPLVGYISNPTNYEGPRGDPADNDHYHYAGVGLAWSFNRRSHHYRTVPIYQERSAKDHRPEDSSIIRIRELQARLNSVRDSAEAAKEVQETSIARLRVKELVIDSVIFGEAIFDQIAKMVRGTIDQDSSSVMPVVKKEVVVVDTIARKSDINAQQDTLESIATGTSKVVLPDSIDNGSRSPQQSDIPVIVDTVPKTPAAPTDTAIKGMPMLKVDESIAPVVTPPPPVEPTDQRKGADTTSAPLTTPQTSDTRSSGQDLPKDQKVQEVPPDPQSGTRSDPERPEIIERTVTVPIQTQVGNKDQYADRVDALEDSLSILKAEQQRLKTAQDSLIAADERSKTGDPPLRSTAEMNARNSELSEMINARMVQRINTLERYMELQAREEAADDSLRNALNEQLRALDRELDQLNDSMAAMRTKASAVKDIIAERPDRGETIGKQAVVDTVYFSTGSFNVEAHHQIRLRAMAAEMKVLSPRMILVTGHSDKSGNSSFNLALSQKRAERVAAILIEAGIQADRIKVKGLGEELARGTYNAKERNVVIQAVLAQ